MTEGCYHCQDTIDHGNGHQCPRCGKVAHLTCLENHGLVGEKGGGMLSRPTTYTKCPACGEEKPLN